MSLQAIQISGHGRPPEVVECSAPVRGPGQSTVRLRAAGLNPVDLAIARGVFYLPAPAPPYIAGAEAVGEIVESERFDPGSRVWCLMGTGAFADLFVVDDAKIVPVPEGPSDAEAVTAGIAGLAGWLGTVRRGGCERGDRVLVLGAHGIVGRVATASARWQEAGRIVAVVRDDEQGEAVLSAGADAWVTSEPGGLEDRITDAMEGSVDLVLDTLWGEPGRAALRSLGVGGRFVQIGNAASATVELPAGPLRAGRLDIRGFSVFNETAEQVAEGYVGLCELVSAGGVDLDIDEIPFGDIEAAWNRQASGTAGVKLVLIP